MKDVTALEFDSVEDYEDYRKKHKMRKDTVVKIKDHRGNSSSGKAGTKEAEGYINSIANDMEVREEVSEYKKENPNLFDFSSLDYPKRDSKLDDGEAARERKARVGAAALLGQFARERVSLVAAKIAKEFKEKSCASIVGKQVRSPEDLAVVAQVFRNPCFETFHFITVKDGKIASSTGISCRLPGAAMAFIGSSPEDVQRTISDFKKQADESDGWYILHNHPSGNVSFSEADKDVTEKYAKELGMEKFLGHVLLNHAKYSYLGKKNSGEDLSLEYSQEALSQYDNVNGESLKPHPLLDRSCGSPKSLASIYAELRRRDEIPGGSVCVIGTNPRFSINSISTIPVEDIPKSSGKLYKLVTDYAKATGSAHFFLANVPKEMEQDMKKAVSCGLIMDAAFEDGSAGINAPRPFTVNFGRKKAPSGKHIGE